MVKRAEADHAARESELSSCVRRVMKQYFHDLDGEATSNVYEMVLMNIEKPMIEVVLTHCGGNQTKAAELLGLNRNTLRKKMQILRIE
ncbi:MAG: helix-turn-helix domain-containing protein [Burkholderiales bacterium]|nr:helix-turn-helix domain-containing protein [Burkholderiales bacterium]